MGIASAETENAKTTGRPSGLGSYCVAAGKAHGVKVLI